jgi:restriction system protein
MTPLAQEIIDIIRQRLSARRADAQADARSASLIMTTQLEKLDAGWARTESWHARNINESTSQAWTNDLKHSHAGHKRRYFETRAELMHQITMLNAHNPEESFDEALVEVAASTIETEISAYVKTLSVKRRQNELRGEYGNTDNARWLAEARKFVIENPRVSSAVDRLQLLDSSLGIGMDWRDFTVTVVDRSISPVTDLPGVAPADGLGFEHACAAILEKCGWVVTITRATGDQGVDILAKKGAIIVAIQCKNTAQPVGNAAVQEVFAGKAFYEAAAAVVVSRSGFTSSAIQLANRLTVTLVDAAVLGDLDQHLKPA